MSWYALLTSDDKITVATPYQQNNPMGHYLTLIIGVVITVTK